MQDEFFIGWQQETPESYSKSVKLFVWLLIPFTLLVAFLLVNTQKEFSTSIFEFGETTILEGTLINTPVPMLRVFHGEDLDGTPVFQHILLVGFGKFGAEQTLIKIEEKIGEDWRGKSVKLSGTLIYHDGLTLMELTDGVESYLGKSDKRFFPQDYTFNTFERSDFSGEIVDPKCFFGVMKPSEGKVHKSCAARCISGGIPPVFAAKNGKYYLILNEDGKKINQEILPFVADYLAVSGKVGRLYEWNILYLSTENICRKGPKWIFKDMPLCSN